MEWTIFIFTDLKDGLQEVEEEIFLIDTWKLSVDLPKKKF